MTAQAAFPISLEEGQILASIRQFAVWLRSRVSLRLSSGLEMIGRIVAMARPVDAAAEASLSPEAAKRFQILVLPHLDSAYNFARYLCGDADAAGDIVQDAFLRAYRSFGGFRDGDPRAWIFAIIRNCHRAQRVDDRRRMRVEAPMSSGASETDDELLAEKVASPADTPEDETMQRSESAAVRRVMAGLAEPMREILLLREFEDLSYRQIAEIIEAPIGTVMSRLARARAEFGEAWRVFEAREARR